MDNLVDKPNAIVMTSGVDGFSQGVGPDLQTLSKSVARLARYKTIDRQISIMNLVDLRKQLEDLARTGLEISMAAEQAQTHLKGFAMGQSSRDQEQWALSFLPLWKSRGGWLK
ncbi:MAG: hypothetical protein C7B46_09930 [Sulfobacillus benefaciens]|uniref:Uncharacterized protein n=1 Tax=Sulfobacillus benefaciens TaxID=453960 RepID=A0A2T2XFW0_9FIRM|nr:MAG: hypothetical protein C7B46_09930 [Sulfobacillus benefaciens]